MTYLEITSISSAIKKGLFKFNITDFHAILGVSVNADVNTIRQRYQYILHLLHPDTCYYENTQYKERAVQLLSKLITPAYMQLSREHTRQAYLEKLESIAKKLAVASTKVKSNNESDQSHNLENKYKIELEKLSRQQYQVLDIVQNDIALISELNTFYLIQREKHVISLGNDKNPSTTTAGSSRKDLTLAKLNYVNQVSPVIPYIRRAEVYMAQKKFLKAIVELRDALPMEPTNSNCHTLLGIAYFKQNLLAMAKVHIKKALELNPENEQALEYKRILDQPISAIAITKQTESGLNKQREAPKSKFSTQLSSILLKDVRSFFPFSNQ